MIALINTVCIGSTGKIITGLQDYLLDRGGDAVVCYGRGPKPQRGKGYKFCTSLDVYIHYLVEWLTGQMNSGSKIATRRLIRFLKKNDVNEIFIENLHGHYLNDKLLFNYLIDNNIKVVYIMADELAFLGNCTYRNECQLNDTTECKGCKRLKWWQRLFFGESSHRHFMMKKKAYEKLNAIYVAPEYVIKQAEKSPLLKGKRFVVVDEAINVNTYHPQDTNGFRMKLGIGSDKVVIVCVAPLSDPRKGVKYFIDAARQLNDNERFVFVHIGYNSDDKSNLPCNYIPVGYVSNQEELSLYYSLGDLFVFPSQADTMPNACLEALACGTPLLCFNVSGMPYIGDETVLTLVPMNDVTAMCRVIENTNIKSQEQIDTCRDYALKRYDNRKYFEKLTEIMENL